MSVTSQIDAASVTATIAPSVSGCRLPYTTASASQTSPALPISATSRACVAGNRENPGWTSGSATWAGASATSVSTLSLMTSSRTPRICAVTCDRDDLRSVRTLEVDEGGFACGEKRSVRHRERTAAPAVERDAAAELADVDDPARDRHVEYSDPVPGTHDERLSGRPRRRPMPRSSPATRRVRSRRRESRQRGACS